MTWLMPIAFAGLLALAIPIVIHLLVRQQSRKRPFPSLRFLRATQMAAIKRRTLQDWPLLVVRLLILLAGVAALAGPVIRWPGRDAAWASRVSRAVIVEAGRGGEIVPPLGDPFRQATFARDDARAALAEAVRWLGEQPPSAREILVSARFRRGWITEPDLALVPPGVGIRIDARDEPSKREQPLAFLERRDGRLYRVVRSMTLGDASTAVREVSAEPIAASPLVVTAGPADRANADAALDAILARGIRWPLPTPSPLGSPTVAASAFQTPLEVAWPGSVTALAEAIDRAVDRPADELEPARVPADTLARWSRAPGPPAADAVPGDEGDRRVFWTLALVLLGVEWWLRGRRAALAASPATAEVRVA